MMISLIRVRTVNVYWCLPLEEVVLGMFSPGGQTALTDLKHSQDLFWPVEHTTVQLHIIVWREREHRDIMVGIELNMQNLQHNKQ